VPVAFGNLASEAADITEVEKVEGKELPTSTNSVEFLDYFDAAVGVATHDDDSVAAAGEGDGRPSDTGGGAGHQSCLPARRWLLLDHLSRLLHTYCS